MLEALKGNADHANSDVQLMEVAWEKT